MAVAASAGASSFSWWAGALLAVQHILLEVRVLP
ncbi:hypothetical protein M878_05715 [Streptomyces roseochromogenus subsp. oscitans DS 12.976]|uniref:Uncharacterized protein n=1 Tax=Streptomyces roseochromogenus subsp. oscitans DS 12.976 TaxID=1352936 RepID=V6KTC8_STRRC|nr:hypothetical protein M878_05715 [Streptomyces roseochromogenus subsp. oscitans DS 12.976]